MEPKFSVGQTVKHKASGKEVIITRVIKNRYPVAKSDGSGYSGFNDEFEGDYMGKWWQNDKYDEDYFKEDSLT